MGIKKLDISRIKYTPSEGEIVQDTVTGSFCIWHEDQWQTIKMENSGITMGVYDMNKQIIAQMPELTDLTNAHQAIDKLQETHYDTYFMLYGKEISYFTLFKLLDSQYFANEVIACLKNIGAIKAIDLTEANDAVEIWVETENGPTVLYLFPYDNGVVCVTGEYHG